MSKVFLRTTVTALVLGAILTSIFVRPVTKASAASNVSINAASTFQVIDGFGASDAFHTGKYASGYGSSLTADQSAKIIELLFSPTTGAGLNIIRHEIGSSTAMVTGVPSTGDGDNLASIEPTGPASGPSGTPTYVWDTADPDKGQIWFTQQAMQYVDPIVYADAWSAPAYMKTNNALYPGGVLCGAVGATACASGDWRQHYANYLTQYAKFYKDAGITLKYIGFGNEPEFSPTTYTGMNWDSTTVAGGRGTLTTAMTQDVDFIKNYLGPTLAAAGLTTKVSCCEATSWDHVATYTSGILAEFDCSQLCRRDYWAWLLGQPERPDHHPLTQAANTSGNQNPATSMPSPPPGMMAATAPVISGQITYTMRWSMRRPMAICTGGSPSATLAAQPMKT